MCQGLGVVVWWIAILGWPERMDAFFPRHAPSSFLYALAPGDLLLVGVGSIVAGVRRDGERPFPVLYVVCGALLFGTAFWLGLWAVGEVSGIGVVMMVGACLGTAWTLSEP